MISDNSLKSIQEIEKIDPEDYKNNPEQLIKFGKQLLKIKKYEKGISFLEKAIRLGIAKYDNDESNINCAKFYVEYAEGLITKLIDSEEIFAETVEQGNSNENNNLSNNNNKNESLDKIENISPNLISSSSNNDSNWNDKTMNNNLSRSNNNNSKLNESEDEEDEKANDNEESNGEEEVQEESDEQIAFENLAFAEKILKNYLKDYEFKETKDLNEDILNRYFELSEVYQKFADLEMCKSDFKMSVHYNLKALKIRKKHDDKFSRIKAEIYYNLSTSYDFDTKKCLICLYFTKTIIEYHLKQELLKLESFKSLAELLIIDDASLDFEERVDVNNIKLYPEVVNYNFENNASKEILELVDILTLIYQKVFYLIKHFIFL